MELHSHSNTGTASTFVRNGRSAACSAAIVATSLAIAGWQTWSLGGEGYRPYRQAAPASSAPADIEAADPSDRVEPPPGRYAPYRPAAPSRETVQPIRMPADDPFKRPVEEDERDRDEDTSSETRDSGWHESGNRPARKIYKTPATEHESGAENLPGLVADDGGPIAEVLLHYAVNSEGELGAIYRDLFQHLGERIRLMVCCPNETSVDAFNSRWGAAAVGAGRQVQVVNVNRPITVWARDRRICRQYPDGRPATCFVPTAHYTYDPEKQNDLVLSSLLFSTGLVPGTTLSSFHLEGGNVVSNRRHVFVGANAFDDNIHRFPSEKAMFAELSRMFGRPTVAIQAEDGNVPWIHTDMYLTPIDSKTILVASPAEGCRILDGQGSFLVTHRERQTQVTFDHVIPASACQIHFDEVASQLTQLGYQVIRMPSLINVEKDWMVTYNNVLMDYQDGQRVVLMPIYRIPELDHAAAQVYRALGFEVRPIDVSPIFQLGGAIRCLANVTRRLPLEARSHVATSDTPGRLQVYSVDPNANRTRPARQPRERRPLPAALRERPQASIQRPVDAGQ